MHVFVFCVLLTGLGEKSQFLIFLARVDDFVRRGYITVAFFLITICSVIRYLVKIKDAATTN